MKVTDTGAGVDFETPQGNIHLVYQKTTNGMVTFTLTQEALADLINLANTGFPQPFATQPGFVQPAAAIGTAETTVTTTTVKRS